MTFTRWIGRNLQHFGRMHAAVGLAVAVATAVLTGAFVVGDSVSYTLRYALENRLGRCDWAILAQERFFTETLSDRIAENWKAPVAPMLQMRGMVANGDGTIRVNQVQILGVDVRFFSLSPGGQAPPEFGARGAFLNESLAQRLQILDWQDVEVVVRIDRPGALSRDLVMSPLSDNTVGARLPALGSLDDAHFGRFSLAANQQAPLSIFVPLSWLQDQLTRVGQANVFLLGSPLGGVAESVVQETVHRAWRLSDAEGTLQPIPKGSGLEMRSARVFLDQPLGEAAERVHPESQTLLTYFVNELRVGEKSAPYSMVTAVNRQGAFANLLPADMNDNHIVINQWLADDLNAGVGDELILSYYLPSGTRPLTEVQREFRIHRIVALEGAAADPSLMPDFPGLMDAENCSDWDPGLPVDLDRIRDQDELYWDDHRGTPKAFVTLAAGQAMWANRYGDRTAMRFPVSPESATTLLESLRTQVDPTALGMFVMPVRVSGDRARLEGTDFGQLFLGLSMFLIAAGILLTGLLFVLGIQNRAGQTGVLLAIGFSRSRIRWLYLLEGGIVAALGALVGTRLGLLYTRALIYGLSTAWEGAVSGSAIRYAASAGSQVTGLLAGFGVAWVAMIWTLRKQMQSSAHVLLSGGGSGVVPTRDLAKRGRLGLILSGVSLIGALVILMFGRSLEGGAMAGAFFGAGFLLLVSLLTGVGQILKAWGRLRPMSLASQVAFAMRDSTRRWGRSLAVIAMLASGVFMVVAVGANRKNPAQGAEKRDSGTGGFSLYGEMAVPLLHDLNDPEGQKIFGLDSTVLQNTRFVPLRVRDGEDASCLNLNRAQQPRLLGVQVSDLASRGAFSFQQVLQESDSPWDLLHLDLGEDVIPVIGDYPTVQWGLGKKLGDDLVYRNHAGRDIRLRLVGMVTSSILQGNLLVAEERLMTHYPAVEGHRALLIDTPEANREAVAAHLTERLTQVGLSVESTVQRLLTFGQVESTYLSIFMVLGGLGLLVGCVGLGLIVVRNLLERQGELAMLRAIGYGRKTLLKMICWEHLTLVLAGLVTGAICAAVAVEPAIRMAAGRIPWLWLAVLLVLILVSAMIWVGWAAFWVLQRSILDPLRNE